MNIENGYRIQGSPEWHEFRKHHVGASEIAIVMGKSPYMSAHDLWLLKTGKTEPHPLSESMERGIAYEAAILQEFEARTGYFTLKHVLVHNDYPFLSASLDGITSDGTVIVEVKYCNKSVFDKAKNGEVVEHYYLQIQQQLLISGAEKGYFFCYNTSYDDFAMVEVLPDHEVQSEIIAQATKFWEYVTNDIEPPVDEVRLVFKPLDTEEAWYTANKTLQDARGKEAIAREALLSEANGEECIGKYVKIQRRVRSSYDYKKACHANSVDMSNFKNKNIEYWTIKEV